MSARVAFLRHGPTRWNLDGRIQGRTDIPLTLGAREKLSRMELPAPWCDAALVASPLRRARDTAALIGKREAAVCGTLVEMDWGVWEGQKGRDLLSDRTCDYRDIEEWGWNFRPPDGESPADIRARLVPWLDRVSGITLAVTHIGVMRVALALAWGWDFSGPCPFSIKRDRLYVIRRTSEGWRPEGDAVRLRLA
jgi:broad specificity phosphatase PhoE